MTEGERFRHRTWFVNGRGFAWERPFFTIPHFDGYATVLVQLKKISKKDLREALLDGWLAFAPAKLAEEYVQAH